MRRSTAPSWVFSVFTVSSLATWGGCATPEDAPFPHVIDAFGAGSAGAAGATMTAAGAGGDPASTGGAAAGSAGAPAAGMGGSSGSSGGTSGSPSAGVGGTGDACPNNPLKTAPGPCGCDTTADQEAACQALIAGLAHRYSFSGTGTTVKDSKGTSDATAINLSLSNTGNLDFTTGDQYADLPNAMISTLTNVTLEAWVTWQGGNAWQRIFDFGEDSTGNENSRGTGRSYIFVAPHGDGNFVRAVFRKPDTPEIIIDSMPSLTVGDPAQVVLVLDDEHDSMALYVNGAASGTAAFTDHLSNVHDINNWLGRSQFAADPAFVGNMQEFRVYSVALSAAQVAFSSSKGADATIFTP